MRWLHSTSNAFDFQGGRREYNSMVYGFLGAGLGLLTALYDGWNVVTRKFHC